MLKEKLEAQEAQACLDDLEVGVCLEKTGCPGLMDSLELKEMQERQEPLVLMECPVDLELREILEPSMLHPDLLDLLDPLYQELLELKYVHMKYFRAETA